MVSQKHYEIQLLPNLCLTELRVITGFVFDKKVDIVHRSYHSRDLSRSVQTIKSVLLFLSTRLNLPRLEKYTCLCVTVVLKRRLKTRSVLI